MTAVSAFIAGFCAAISVGCCALLKWPLSRSLLKANANLIEADKRVIESQAALIEADKRVISSQRAVIATQDRILNDVLRQDVQL